MRTPSQLRQDILLILGEMGREELQRATSAFSRTLADTYEIRRTRRGVRIQSPYFWSGVLDQGRGPVHARPGRLLVFFRDPLRQDPRISGGYPRRKSQVRRLTEREYKNGLLANRLADQAGAPRPMIVAKSVGPFEGYHFTERARPEIVRRGREEIQGELALWVREQLSEVPNGAISGRI